MSDKTTSETGESDKGKVVTANRLSDGKVVFLTSAAVWSEDIDSAVVALEPQAAAALGERGRQAEAANLITGSYLIDAERREGKVWPVHIRERIRSLGPTIAYGKHATIAYGEHGEDETERHSASAAAKR